MMENIRQMNFRQAGTYDHISFKYLTGDQADLIKTHPEITSWGESIVIGIAEDEGLKNRQVEIRYADDAYATYSYAIPTTGTMPAGEYDIALDTAILDVMGLPHELGQKVTLHWRDDLYSEALTGQEFVLCGYWEGNASSLASMAFVSRQFTADKYAGADIAGRIAQNQVGGTHMSVAYTHLPLHDHVRKVWGWSNTQTVYRFAIIQIMIAVGVVYIASLLA